MRNSPILSAMALTLGSVPALPQEEGSPVAMVDCIVDDMCIGTPGNDTITGSQGQDTIYALEGDDIIDPGNDLRADYVSCGPGYDVVNQQPRVLPDAQEDILQYAAEPDVIADDCELRAL